VGLGLELAQGSISGRVGDVTDVLASVAAWALFWLLWHQARPGLADLDLPQK
jgi:hypothetical protein